MSNSCANVDSSKDVKFLQIAYVLLNYEKCKM
jgi:hypothetical protein